MATWKTRGLRGSTLEEMINITNEAYKQKKLALIQKIPTPITPTKIDQSTRTIKEAFFEQKSTVDYIGVVQSIPVCFDAKATSSTAFPLQNIHNHQVEFMENFANQKGIAFLIVHFTSLDEYYFLPIEVLLEFWNNSKNGGRKSIPYKNFEKKYQIFNKLGFYVHYLEGLSVYLEASNEK